MGVPLRYNLRNLFERRGTTIMTAVGIGLTVAVLVTSIAMATGMNAVFAGTGHPLQMLILRDGSDAELTSSITQETWEVVRQLPGIARTSSGEVMASPEGLVVINLPSIENPDGMNVSVRGILPIARTMRPTVQLTRGVWNEPGKRELVTGEGIAKRYPSCRVGQTLKFGHGDWKVVGEFSDSEGGAANSELWADLPQLRGDMEQQGGCSSVLLRVDSPAAIEPMKQAVKNDQRLKLSSIGEREYYESLKKNSSGVVLNFIGFFVAIVMAIGAGFAATNTMYAAVSRRSREIGTLRALGFSRFSILTSFTFEAICLALIGGVLGCLIALPLNNLSAGIGNWTTFSEMAFKFRVTPLSIVLGLLFAAVIGLLGGFLPAWSAAKKNVVTAMREA
ncbi:MAG TPA: ABC transporter permease [Tepidisphaeraceae bacterium]|jgi:ABC-type lipoprotein release transport system permease subunit